MRRVVGNKDKVGDNPYRGCQKVKKRTVYVPLWGRSSGQGTGGIDRVSPVVLLLRLLILDLILLTYSVRINVRRGTDH